jgi:hypothetical protein
LACQKALRRRRRGGDVTFERYRSGEISPGGKEDRSAARFGARVDSLLDRFGFDAYAVAKRARSRGC